MPTFKIEVYETHVRPYEVEADTLEEALKIYDRGEADASEETEDLGTDLEKGRNSVRSVETPDGTLIWWDQLPEE